MTTNRWPGICDTCNVRVAAGSGELRRSKEPGKKWITLCVPCATGRTAPQAQVHDLTPEQHEALRLFAEGVNLAIVAGAGTGKTSTMEAIGRSTTLRGQYLAFNAAIVQDASGRMPANVACSTSHSLAFRAVGKRYAHRLESPRMRSQDVARKLGIKPFGYQLDGERRILQPSTMAGMVMGGIGRFCNSADEQPTQRHLSRRDPLDEATNEALVAHLYPALRSAWTDLSSVNGELRFSHDVYRKLWQLSRPTIRADFILLDEAQDTAPVLADVVFQQDAHVIVVGDPYQEIYAWAGAIDAMAQFPAERQSSLTWSFRFGEQIAEVANRILRKIPGPGLTLTGKGPAGKVEPCDQPKAILTRTNGGAIERVISAREAGRRPFLVGGGGAALAFARGAQELMGTGRTEHPELACFASWGEAVEYAKADELGVELQAMVRLIERFGVDQVIGALDNAVPEAKADVVISTAHKAKGRQWESVQIAGDFPTEEVSIPEWKLLYVAATRAQRHLDVSRCQFLAGMVHDAAAEAQ